MNNKRIIVDIIILYENKRKILKMTMFQSNIEKNNLSIGENKSKKKEEYIFIMLQALLNIIKDRFFNLHFDEDFFENRIKKRKEKERKANCNNREN